MPDVIRPYDRSECCYRMAGGVAHERTDLLDWSIQPPSIDQTRIVEQLAGMNLSEAQILHVGVGSSALAITLADRVRFIAGLTLHPEEQRYAHSLQISNYRVWIINKYSPLLASLPGPFEFIVDNNPASFACCWYHYRLMWDQYSGLLASGGRILTDENGLAWTPAGNEPWRLSFAELEQLGTRFPLRARKLTATVYCLERTQAPAN